jgi:hypothetical protein
MSRSRGCAPCSTCRTRSDAEALTLMAEAHARNGNARAARDFLSLAVEESDAAPAESIRYAASCWRTAATCLAEEIVIDALRLAPGHPELLSASGRSLPADGRLARAAQVERTLRRQDGPEASRGPTVQDRLLQPGQGQTEEALALSRRACRGGSRKQPISGPDRGRPSPADPPATAAGRSAIRRNLLAGDPGKSRAADDLAAVPGRVPAICRGRDRLP